MQHQMRLRKRPSGAKAAGRIKTRRRRTRKTRPLLVWTPITSPWARRTATTMTTTMAPGRHRDEIRAKDEAGSLWKRVEVCTEAWAVCACMPACIYSSSFLMSSQDPNSGGKAEAPGFFFMHWLGASVCSSCRYIYVPNYGDDVGRPRTEVCDLCR